MTTAWERVTERLTDTTGYTPPRDNAEWRCPAHGDNKPSLSLTRSDGRVVLHCQAGCATEDVVNALRLRMADLFDKPRTNGNSEDWTPRGEAVAVYKYTDENNFTLFEVCRTADKQFPLRVPDSTKPGGYRWSIGDTRRVIYRLPKVIEAVREGWPVWVTEGEKDVHALEAAGEVATCNPGGAEKWRPEYAKYLTGAHVFVVADKDGPGRRHARRVVESLEGHAAKVVVVEAVTGKDAADHLAAGHTVEDFLRIRDEEVFAGEDPAPDTDTPPLVRPFIPVALDITSRPEPRPTVAEFLYRAGLTVLQSEPGVGKTWLALHHAVEVMRGGGFVLYFDEEGGEDLARERLYALGATNELVDGRMFYFPFEGRVWDNDDLLALDATIAMVQDRQAIAVFDSLPDFLAAAGKSEDSAQDVTGFINNVLGRLRRAGIAQLVLDHMRKPEQGKGKAERSRYARGSGAKLAKADATILLEVAEPFDANRSGKLRYWKTKDRYGRLNVPRLDEPGRIVDVNVGDGRLTIQPAHIEVAKWDGPTECMEQIMELLGAPDVEEISQTAVRKALAFQDATVVSGLQRLVQKGDVLIRQGPRGALMYRLKNRPSELFEAEDF